MSPKLFKNKNNFLCAWRRIEAFFFFVEFFPFLFFHFFFCFPVGHFSLSFNPFWRRSLFGAFSGALKKINRFFTNMQFNSKFSFHKKPFFYCWNFFKSLILSFLKESPRPPPCSLVPHVFLSLWIYFFFPFAFLWRHRVRVSSFRRWTPNPPSLSYTLLSENTICVLSDANLSKDEAFCRENRRNNQQVVFSLEHGEKPLKKCKEKLPWEDDFTINFPSPNLFLFVVWVNVKKKFNKHYHHLFLFYFIPWERIKDWTIGVKRRGFIAEKRRN